MSNKKFDFFSLMLALGSFSFILHTWSASSSEKLMSDIEQKPVKHLLSQQVVASQELIITE